MIKAWGTRALRGASVVAIAAASASAQSQCDRPIDRWLVVGPWPVDSGALRLDRQFLGDETAVQPRAGDPGADRRWVVAESDTMGRVNLNALFTEGSNDQKAAYAFTYIVTPDARRVKLLVESDDDVVIWLNGARLSRHDVARGVGTSADTVTLPLTPGVNRLLYKVVNRGGGFGLGGRLMAASDDAIADLVTAVVPGAAWAARTEALSVGRVVLGSRAVLTSTGGRSRLGVPVTVCVSRSAAGPTTGQATLAGATAPIRLDRAGKVEAVTFASSWSDLAATGGQATLAVSGPTAAAVNTRVDVPASRLLELLSRPILANWRLTTDDPASPSAQWRAVDSVSDSTARRAAKGLRLDATVPSELAGLTLVADAAEFGPNANYAVNGVPVRPDRMGRVTACTACRAGAPLVVTIEPTGRWWDAPRLRVEDIGWREIAEGARWARYFNGDSAIALPTNDDAQRMLAAAREPDKRTYLGLVSAWLGRLQPFAARDRADTIDAVGNSHIDAAWLWRWRETQDVVEHTWGTATKLLQKYPEMHFAASAAQYYVWLEQRDPALLDRIRGYVRDGRWDLVGGWWVEPDENIPAGESLVRQGLYGQRTFRRLFGRTSRVAWTPDTFGYPWTLPQIFRKSGFDFFVTQKLRWSETNKWPARLNAFWWQAPDGSRVFTYIPYGYDHDLNPGQLARELTATKDSSASDRMLVLYGVGDHGGGPTMEMLERARDLRRVPTYPVLRDVSPDSSLSRMRADAGNENPTVRDELYLEYHRGVFTTQAAMKAWNRRMEGLLGAAEAAAASSPLPYPRAELQRAWERVLMNEFHDILPGSGIDSVYMDAEVDYRLADSIATAVLERSVRAMAGRGTRGAARGRAFAVFNPSPWTRTELVTLPTDSSGTPVRVTVPALSTVMVTAQPTAGARSVTMTAAVGAPVIENARLRLEIDPATGNVARLYDRVARRDVLRNSNALVLIEDHPKDWDAWNIDRLDGPRAWVDSAVSIEAPVVTATTASIVVHRSRGGAQVTQRYVLPTHATRVEVETTVDWRENRRMLKAVLPMPFTVDSTHAEIPYGVIGRTTRPANRVDSARFETPMQRWVDVDARDGAYGVALVNDSKYGYSANQDTLFLTLLRSPKWPDEHADMHVHRFTYAIVPHAGDWRAEVIRQAATSLNEPLRVIALDSLPARVASGSRVPLVTVEGTGVVVGAIKRAEDDQRVIVRLAENTGQRRTVRLRFRGAVRSAAELDMLELNMVRRVPSVGRVVTVTLEPWEIRTIAVSGAF